jgi:hypothetical protein
LGSEDDIEDSARKITIEGIGRAIKKTDQLSERILEVHEWSGETLKMTIQSFVNTLEELTDNENVFELKYRIAKAKAIKTSTQLKDQLLIYLKRSSDFVIKKTRWFVSASSSYTEHLSKIYGFSDQSSIISAEISNFLAETNKSIGKLPYVYQRLFKLEPVTGNYLFFFRQNEIISLREAYSNWKIGRYAPVAVVAEKGAGITSVMNFFLKEINQKMYILNLSSCNDCYKVDNLLNLLSETLNTDKIESFEDAANLILSSDMPSIILVDGLQFAFLRKVHGFECIKYLLELISRTHSKVFWIVTCTKQAWDYLNRTLKINEYFGHLVEFGELTDQEMIELVKKRHKVSGYNLRFLPSSFDVENSKYRKMNDEERQSYLEREFFSQLNRLALGNVSIALLFWMRATNDVKKNTIYLNSMKAFDLSFFKSLETEKLFSIYSLLLHDGLSIEEFSKVMNQSPEHSRMQLIQMKDDGILIEMNNRYFVNLLLYRSAVNLLTDKNIIQ